jgi:hypothetical protein
MRAAVGLLALNGLLAAVGLGVLGVAGLLRLRVRALVAAVPAGLLAGTAIVGFAGVIVLTVGGTIDPWPFFVGMAVLAAVLWAVTLLRRRAAPDEEPRFADRGDRWLFWIVTAAVVVFVLVQAYASRNVRAAWDAEHNWTLKALALSSGGLDSDMFTARLPFAAAHLDYPILQPVLGALVFRVAGKAENGLIVSQLWLLGGAFVLAVPWIIGRLERGWLALLPAALALAALTSFGVLRTEADITMAVFLGAGALALARWIDDGPPGLAVLAAVLLGGALNIKNEGLAYTAAIVVTALVVLALTSPRRLLGLAGIAGGLVVFALPWQLWVSAHGPFARDVTPLSTSLDLGFLTDRLHRLDFAAQTVINRFNELTLHVWLVPMFLALAISLLVSGPRRRIPAFYLGSIVGTVCALLWVYWTTSQPDWAEHIQRTSARTIAGPLFIAAVALAHLLPQALAPSAAVDRAQGGRDDVGSGAGADVGERAPAGGTVAP